MAENISNVVEPPKQIGKVEQIEDNDGPALPPAMMGDDVLFNDSLPTKMPASTAAAEGGQDLAFVNELSPPTPFNIAEFEDGDDALTKKMAKKDMMDQKPAAAAVTDDYSVYVPSRQDIEGGDSQDGNINRGDGSGNRRGWRDMDIESQLQPIQTQQGGIMWGIIIINHMI